MRLILKSVIVCWLLTLLIGGEQSEEVIRRSDLENIYLKKKLRIGPQTRTFNSTNNSEELSLQSNQSLISKKKKPKKKKYFSEGEIRSAYVKSLVANFGFLFCFLISSLIVIFLVMFFGNEYFRSILTFFKFLYKKIESLTKLLPLLQKKNYWRKRLKGNTEWMLRWLRLRISKVWPKKCCNRIISVY